MNPADNHDMFEHAPTHGELAGIDAPDKRWPRTLAEHIDVLSATYRGMGVAEAQALDYAEQGVLALGKYNGGRQIYLPTGERLRIAVRDRRLYMEYCGTNKAELAQRYGITERRVEQIAAEQRAIYIRRIQPDLFGTATREEMA